MATIRLKISGMNCEHCSKSAQDALNAVPGVSATVSLADAEALVETTGEIDAALMVQAVESKGYQASLPPGEGD